jgi:hypothetical protein
MAHYQQAQYQQPRHQERHVLFYSTRCLNCKRFMESMNRTPAANIVQCVDIDRVPPASLGDLQAVPTLVSRDTGVARVGQAAFEWLKAYEHDLPLETFQGGGGLSFSEFGRDGAAKFTGMPYSDVV